MTARKRKQPEETTEEPSCKQVAYIVAGHGTNEEIRARCVEGIPGFDSWSEHVQADTIRLMRHYWDMQPAPQYEVATGSSGSISIRFAEDGNTTLNALRLVETMGSNSQAYCDERISDLANYHRKANTQGVTSGNLQASLAFVSGANATDTVQSTLAVQMAATHDAAMRSLSMVGKAQFTEQVQMYGNLATKLLNAYTRQAETLAKLQRGGEQVIKHVHIDNRGGQAVVADQFVTGGINGESRDQAHGTRNAAQRPALLGKDPQGNGVSIASDLRKEAVQASWGAFDGRA